MPDPLAHTPIRPQVLYMSQRDFDDILAWASSDVDELINDTARCPDCGCPKDVMVTDGSPCCQAEWDRVVSYRPTCWEILLREP